MWIIELNYKEEPYFVCFETNPASTASFFQPSVENTNVLYAVVSLSGIVANAFSLLFIDWYVVSPA